MLKSKRFFSSDALFYAITTFLYVFCLYFVGRNLWATELWYDEAGQFFISHGLNHWSEPLSPDGNLADAMVANHDYNQDPGGFTALLYFWCKISSSHVWLRLLPFLFYLGSIVFVCLLSFNILINKKLAYASGLIVFAFLGGNFAHELRAYSMELCGLTYGLWMVLQFKKMPSLPRALILSLALCLFITSRYTMLVVGGILSCFVLYQIVSAYVSHTITLNRCIALVSAYALPLLCVVLLVWRFQMSYQNPGVKAMSYVQYVQPGITVWFFIFISALLICSQRWQNDASKSLLAIFVAINAVFIILGFFQILPWNLKGNKGALFMLLMYVTAYNSFMSLLNRNKRLRKFLPYLVLCIWCLYMVAIKSVGIANIYGITAGRTEQIETALSVSGNPVYVSSWNSPEVRYLYEFGSLRDRAENDGYPNRFIFMRRDKHCIGIAKKNYKKLNAELIDNAPSGTVVYSTNSYTDSVPASYSEFEQGIFIKK